MRSQSITCHTCRARSRGPASTLLLFFTAARQQRVICKQQRASSIRCAPRTKPCFYFNSFCPLQAHTGRGVGVPAAGEQRSPWGHQGQVEAGATECCTEQRFATSTWEPPAVALPPSTEAQHSHQSQGLICLEKAAVAIGVWSTQVRGMAQRAGLVCLFATLKTCSYKCILAFFLQGCKCCPQHRDTTPWMALPSPGALQEREHRAIIMETEGPSMWQSWESSGTGPWAAHNRSLCLNGKYFVGSTDVDCWKKLLQVRIQALS